MSNVRPLPSKLSLKVNQDSKGSPIRFKGSLVVRGNFQTDIVKSTKLYAPFSCIELVCLVLNIVMANNCSVHKLYVEGAFLHATLSTDDMIWVKLRVVPGIGVADGRIVHLVTSLYGLRQAPKRWYELFRHTVQRFGFERKISASVCSN